MFLAKYLPFFLLLGAALALKNEKDCDLKQAIDKCIKSDFLVESGDKKFKNLPKNENEMNTVCENVKKAEECTKDFIEKCADNDKEKRALDHSLEGMVRVVKRVCKTDAKKKEFVEHTEKCGNAVLNDGKKCLNDYKRNLIAASKLDDKDKIKKILCCKIKDVPPCIQKKMKEKGDSICNEKDIQWFADVKESMKEEMVSVPCADFDKDTDAKCAGIEVPEMKEAVEDKSLAEALKKILDKIDL